MPTPNADPTAGVSGFLVGHDLGGALVEANGRAFRLVATLYAERPALERADGWERLASFYDELARQARMLADRERGSAGS